jgi:predicted nucleic acid-binding protein
MNKIYLDSCIVIYLVEKHPIYFPSIQDQLGRLKETSLAISPLVRLEVLVKPMRDANHILLQRYETFLSRQIMLEMPNAVFDLALSLRVQYPLKTPDALHIATATYHQCQSLWTNDNRLFFITDININRLH